MYDLFNSVKNPKWLYNTFYEADIVTLALTLSYLTEDSSYLNKIQDADLYAYNVYQIEGEGRNLFSRIDGEEETIMGLPINSIKEYFILQ